MAWAKFTTWHHIYLILEIYSTIWKASSVALRGLNAAEKRRVALGQV